MNLLDLFEAQQHPAYANLEALQQAVKANRDATVDFGSGPTTVEYPVARYILGRYQAQQTGADRGQFLAALADARRFDAIAKEYQQMANQARLEEQYSGPPKAIGTAFMALLLKHQKDQMPVMVDFEDGGQKWRINGNDVKDWFVNTFNSYDKRGKRDQFLEMMGSREGFVKIVKRYAQEQARAERDRLLGTDQKKRTDVAEADDESARTQRIINKLRVQQPQAKSDMEALVYSFLDAQQQDQDAINKLEKEIDSTEKNVKSDLKTALGKLRGRGEKAREKLGGVSAADERQDALLKKIVALDQQQSQAIDDLEKEIEQPAAPRLQPSAATAAQPTQQAEPKARTGGRVAGQLSQTPGAVKKRQQRAAQKAAATSEPEAPNNVVNFGARRAAKIQPQLPGLEIEPGSGEMTDVGAGNRAKNVKQQMLRNPDRAEQGQAGNPEPVRQQLLRVAEDPADIVKPRLIRLHYFRVNPQDRDLAEKAGLRQDRGGNWVLPQYDKSGSIFNQKMAQATNMFGRPTHTQFMNESLRRGEYHEATVTFDDGSKQTVKITSDEGFRDQITQHFAKQGKKVTDINVDWSVKSVNEGEKKPKPTNPQLWGRAKSAAKSKFDVYPSAYANAWAAKWYKQHGGGWR